MPNEIKKPTCVPLINLVFLSALTSTTLLANEPGREDVCDQQSFWSFISIYNGKFKRCRNKISGSANTIASEKYERDKLADATFREQLDLDKKTLDSSRTYYGASYSGVTWERDREKATTKKKDALGNHILGSQ